MRGTNKEVRYHYLIDKVRWFLSYSVFDETNSKMHLIAEGYTRNWLVGSLQGEVGRRLNQPRSTQEAATIVVI